MAAPKSIPELLTLIRNSGVLDGSRLDTFLTDQPPPIRSPLALAAALVQAGLLTPFQAERLLLGKCQGFILDSYKILERLGAGGGCEVFLAEHLDLRRRVALQILSQQAASDPRVVERFRRQARAAANLDHPNIVHAYDVGSVGQLHYLVMEYVEGTSLQALVDQSGPLEPERVADHGWQVARALIHLRQAGLVHRDIKPSNLLLDRSGIVKLADLGLARFCHDQKDPFTRPHGTGIPGTVDYLAPEQTMDGHEVDIRTDIYSLGVTLYFLLVGLPPFPDRAVAQKLVWVQLREPEDVRQLRPEVPEGLATVVRRMMKKNPRDRYQTPEEVEATLAAWASAEAMLVEQSRSSRLVRTASMLRGLPVVAPLPVVPPAASVQTETLQIELAASTRSRTGRVRSAPGSPADRSPARKPNPGFPWVLGPLGWCLGGILLGLVIVGIFGGVLLWLTKAKQSVPELPLGLLHCFEGHDSRVEAVAWSPDGSRAR